jgi:hypothetical protein
MEFKVGDLVVVNEANNICYYGNEIGPVFVISEANINSMIAYGYHLGDQTKTTIILIIEAYRIATESEIKKYKMKKLFTK